MDKIVVDEIKRISLGVILLDGVLLVIMLILGRMSHRMLWGVLFSSCFAILNFVLLGLACTRAVQKSEKSAKLSIRLSYAARLLLTGVVVYIGLSSSHLDPLGVIIPLLFPVIAIYLMNFVERRREGGRS
ncbi:ATP synthase subunit I [Zongyangia hominis]|uniref:ATP synthase subunit I n=1 Tax=Zongyangia hominis TaxID=2763677 RepID=A0A926EB68_9FIRM|nr:ATP synthase subunit I [Zongyangia hominis]MBC8569843.1 ATP synthase subunit I [Zongyangia hominis]